MIPEQEARVEKCKLMDTDRIYEYKIQDAEELVKKMLKMKRLCKPGVMIGPLEVVKAYEHHCLFKDRHGHKLTLDYCFLANNVIFNKSSQKLHTL